MDQYNITLTGLSPLLMHQDNIAFGESLKKWRTDPANKELSQTGDDRSPAWTWLGYIYHDRKVLGMNADNIMTMLREGGAKVKTGNGKETYKKHTQSGIMLDQQQFTLLVNGNTVPVAALNDLIGVTDFTKHLEVAEQFGFELLVKRAKVGMSKHVRVRPLFREWVLTGSLTILDPELSGLSEQTLDLILRQAGSLCGLGDWRPSSPSSGTFGRFAPTVEKVKAAA